MRWVTENGRTSHAVHEEATGWARTEKSMALVFWCGWDSNETWLKAGEPKHCQNCEKAVNREVDAFLGKNICNPETGVHAIPHSGRCILR